MEFPQHKDASSLEVWLADIQSYLHKTIRGPLDAAGYRFDRTDYSFRRKSWKCQQEISFAFVSQFPVRYRIGLTYYAWHPAIEQVKRAFLGELVQKRSDLCSICLHLKNVVGDPGEMEHFAVQTQRDLFLAADAIEQGLESELLPLAQNFRSVAALDEFFAARPDWSLETGVARNLCTDLIAARLNRKRNFHDVFMHLSLGVQHRIDRRQMSKDVLELLLLCYENVKK